jgi:hypothetical protein
MIKVPNPAYEEWYARDQQILGFLFTSVTKDVLSQITAAKKAAQAWSAVENMFTAQMRARTMNMRLALTTTKKGSMTIAEYFGKMKSLSDEMAAAGKQLDEKEIVANILNGLDGDLNPVMSALVTRAELTLVGEVYAQLLSFETRLEFEDGTDASINSANRGHGGSSIGHGGAGRGTSSGRGNQGRGAGRGRGNQQQRPNSSNQRGQGSSGDSHPLCQVCFKRGHLAPDCWHRYDENYVPDERLVAAAMNTYSVDTNWYTDIGATNHVTSDLEKLSICDK